MTTDTQQWWERKEKTLADLGKIAAKSKPLGCRGCPWFDRPFVAWQGQIKTAPIVIVGQNGGADEGLSGIPFDGRAGEMLDGMLADAGVDRQKAVANGTVALTNVAKCVPPFGRTTDASEMFQVVKQCRDVYLNNELATRKKQPDVIIALGDYAMYGLTNRRGISTVRGTPIASAYGNVVPTFHPAYVLRSGGAGQKGGLGARKIVVDDLRYALQDVAVNGLGNTGTPTEARICVTKKDLALAEKALSGSQWLGIDFEDSNGFQPGKAHPILLALSNEKGVAWMFPLPAWPNDATRNHPGKLWMQIVTFVRQYPKSIRQTLRNILLSSKRWAIQYAIHDLKDVKAIAGIDWWDVLPRVYDPVIGQMLIDENVTKSLDELAPLWTTMRSHKQELKSYLSKPKNKDARENYADVPPELLITYCAADADKVRRIALKQSKALTAEKMDWYYQERRLPLVGALLDAYEHGVLLDRFAHQAFIKAAEQEIKIQTKYLRDIAQNDDLNPNSPPQMAKLLYDTLGCPVDEENGRSTAKGVLEDLDTQNAKRPKSARLAVEALIEYRFAEKQQGTYGEGMLWYIWPDGRIRSHLSPGLTVSGRLSSSEPNMQNLPRKDKKLAGINVRQCFVAPPGHKLIVADYSQVELVAAAILSGDKEMLRIFREGKDIHLTSAAMILGKPALLEGGPEFIEYVKTHLPKLAQFIPKDLKAPTPREARLWEKYVRKTERIWEKHFVTNAERSWFKAFVFGKLYGATDDKLAAISGKSAAVVARIFTSYWATFKGLKRWIDKTISKINTKQVLTGAYGLKRRFHGGDRRTNAQRSRQERQGVNFEAQHVGGELTSGAFTDIQREFRKRKMKARMILNVHDENIAEAPDDEVEAVVKLMSEVMLRPQPQMQHYVFKIKLGVGQNLLAAEDAGKSMGTFQQVLPKSVKGVG